jgi:hypothetical protein
MLERQHKTPIAVRLFYIHAFAALQNHPFLREVTHRIRFDHLRASPTVFEPQTKHKPAFGCLKPNLNLAGLDPATQDHGSNKLPFQFMPEPPKP